MARIPAHLPCVSIYHSDYVGATEVPMNDAFVLMGGINP